MIALKNVFITKMLVYCLYRRERGQVLNKLFMVFKVKFSVGFTPLHLAMFIYIHTMKFLKKASTHSLSESRVRLVKVVDGTTDTTLSQFANWIAYRPVARTVSPHSKG